MPLHPTLEPPNPPYGLFTPFIVPAPETPAIPPIQIIYPTPPTNFPTNLVTFQEEVLPIPHQFISITPPPSSPS